MEMMDLEVMSQVLNIERVRELEAWVKTTNTKLTQVNGQRKYGGPPEVWHGPLPGARCEVFISHIPQDAYEDLLIPLFSSVGPLWEFRLMMNFSGQNRGFAYAKYGSSATATVAIRQLNGYLLEPGYRLSVRRSVEKRHLSMGDLPGATRREDLLQALRVLVEGVEDVSLKAGPGIDGVRALITFSSHHTASMAKKMLVEAFKKKFELTISVQWHSAVKLDREEPYPPLQPPMGLLATTIKAPHHVLSSPSRYVPPPRLAHSPSIPPGFCRAVGGPTGSQHPPSPSSPTTTTTTTSSSSSSTQGPLQCPSSSSSSASPVMLLCKLSEARGAGHPRYEISYSHAASDGFLCFTYKVYIPGLAMVFEGRVMILPGPNTATMLREAQQAAAQQVLQRMHKK